MAIQDLMNAIAQFEGYNTVGTIAQRNNNPGNLRWAANQSGTVDTPSGKFARFDNVDDGWAALQKYVEDNQGLTLRQFTYKYAPPVENNTSSYLNFLTSRVGIGADDTLSSLMGSGGANDTGNGNQDLASGVGDMVSDSSGGLLVALGAAVLVWVVSR